MLEKLWWITYKTNVRGVLKQFYNELTTWEYISPLFKMWISNEVKYEQILYCNLTNIRLSVHGHWKGGNFQWMFVIVAWIMVSFHVQRMIFELNFEGQGLITEYCKFMKSIIPGYYGAQNLTIKFRMLADKWSEQFSIMTANPLRSRFI